MTTRPLLMALAITLAAALGACASSGQTTGSSTPDAELIETGADLYARNCAQCHGDDLGGTDQGPSFFSRVYEPNHHADGAFLLAVQRGVQPHHWDFGPMPPIAGLSAEDVEAIVAVVRDRQHTEGFDS